MFLSDRIIEVCGNKCCHAFSTFEPLSTTTSRLFIRMTKISFPHSQENYIIEMTLTTCFKRDHLIWTFLAMYRFREVEEYLQGVIIEPNTVDESVLDCRMASVLFQWQTLYLSWLSVRFIACFKSALKLWSSLGASVILRYPIYRLLQHGRGPFTVYLQIFESYVCISFFSHCFPIHPPIRFRTGARSGRKPHD